MKHESKWHIIFNIMRIALMYVICLAIGYGGSSLLFGWMPITAFLSYIISAILGTVLFGVIARLISVYILKGHNDARMALLHETVEAIEKIAHGNFDISVQIDKHDPFSEIADSVNKMAHELGNMENMRQDFISNVSHEIQSPLTSIGGFAALMKKERLSDEERFRYADIIETEARRLSGLSDNLLKLSALNDKPLEKTEYRLDKQLSSAILALEPQWSKKQLAVEADLRKFVINADADLLSQVWMNLLNNATKFTPDGGTIRISITDNAVEIADTGTGIGKEDLPHIFERFYKVDKSRDRKLGGNGLGLPIVKKIIELHGGTISVDSEPGKGSMFTVRL